MSELDEQLASPEIQIFIGEKLQELRKRLLDSSRRNPLINIHFRPTSTSILRVVDELPDVLRFNLTNGKPMRFAPLPALEEELPDEQTDDFLNALFLARKEDEQYNDEVEKVETTSEKAEEGLLKIERALKDRTREALNLPPRQTKDDLSLTQHAKNHKIAPSYILPLAEDENEDGRHQDTDIQTLLLPERLARVAKGILEKGRSFERETGVNVLHAAFGLLEWKDPAERAKFVSPLLLLEIRIERKQSTRGAQFSVSGLDKVFVNTTLAQKFLTEHQISMPEYNGGSVEDYFAEIHDKAPQDWHWRVRREVVFGIFPSSKIAMYHDLNPEMRPITSNNVVAKLMASTGGGDGSYADIYETDNPAIAKLVPYLVLDADSSQYSALVDIAEGKNLSIEGPPGSGKSQSIVNIVAAALADNKRVLFVAEKLTALDVVKNRLEAVGLGAFILPLQAGRGTREKIYESLAERLALGRGSGRAGEDFRDRQNMLERRRAILQDYLDALGSQFGSSGMTVYQVIGHGIATADDIRDDIPREVRRIRLDSPENLNREAISALVGDAEAFAERLGQIHRMPKLWLATNSLVVSRDDAEDSADAAGQLASQMECFVSDIATSDLAPFLSTSPLSGDLGEIETLLRTVALDAARIDPVLVETLTHRGSRHLVQTLCGQVQERQTAIARLSRYLQDPLGWNIGNRIEAARVFAEENSGCLSPMMHCDRITEIEEDIAETDVLITLARDLPDNWTGKGDASLVRLRDDARRLMATPDAVLAIRRNDKSRRASQLATELTDTIRTLATDLGNIRQGLPKAGKHDLAQIGGAAQTIASSGAFRILSKDFKSARNTYRNVLGGQNSDDRRIMSQRLEAYTSWLKKRHDLEGDGRFREVFGEIFDGLATDLNQVSEATNFFSIAQDIAGGDSVLQSILETGDLAAIKAISRAEVVTEDTLAELGSYVSVLRSELENEKILLEEARGHIALFKDRDKVDLGEIEKCELLGNHIADLTNHIETSEAASFLGANFAGVDTKTDLLQIECAIAEKIAAAPDPAQAVSILRSGTASSLLSTLEDFRARRHEIEGNAFDLWTRLSLPKNLCSTLALYERIDDLKAAAEDSDALLDRSQLKRSEETIREQGFDTLVDWVMEERLAFDPERLGHIVRAIITKNMVDRAYDIHAEKLQGYDGKEFDRIRKEIAEKDRQLITVSRNVIRNQLLANAQPPAGNNIGRKSTYTNMSLIFNEMNKKRNRIGVRELTRRAGPALLELKPCWMMSPLAVAQYLHEGMEFDLVVIDEASQMTPENAVGALSRAKQAVIVGDTKQLPPTSFFRKMLDEAGTDVDLREDSESILDMANVAFMPIRQFRWHYRSRHSGLIQFSNKTMYKGELTIFPSAQEDHPDLGVELNEVPGVYKSRRNEIEARAVVAAAVKHMEQKPGLSLGICTMNMDQRDLILHEFERERDRNSEVQAYIARWEDENDALEEFFIKNLETIQGDERDVMFISTLYGPEVAGGRVLQRFGPVNSAHGHRRLNVLFTRAKRKMVTFTSLKPTDIIVEGARNYGVQMFREWLEYCKTGYIAETGRTTGETESPFEDYVAQQIEAMGCEVVPQVGVAGFRIDLGVRHPEWPYGYILGVECDGATYHSSKSSRDRDRLRQEVLENLGWKLHRIWSTDWFRNPRAEVKILRQVIDESLALVKKSAAPSPGRTDPTESYENIAHIAAKNVKPREEPKSAVAIPPSVGIPPDEMRDDLFSHISILDEPREGIEPPAGFGGQMTSPEPIVAVGSKVKVENLTDGGKKLAFTLVQGANDPDEGFVGIHTPLGAALIDAQVGDDVEYQVGSHIKEIRVLEIQ